MATIKGGLFTKGGSAGGSEIPVLEIAQSQIALDTITLTADQVTMMQDNDTIIFKCDYLGKRLVMNKIRWDGIFSANSSTPQTDIVFQSFLLKDETTYKYESVLQLTLASGSSTASMETISFHETPYSNGCYTTDVAPTEDDGDLLYDIADIDLGDAESLKYGDIIIYSNNGSAEKIYYVDDASDEEAIIVLEKASISSGGGGGSQLYQHNVKITSMGVFLATITIINSDSTPITDIRTITSWLQTNGFTATSPNYMIYPLGFVYSTSTQKLVSMGVAYDSNNEYSFKYMDMQSGIQSTGTMSVQLDVPIAL